MQTAAILTLPKIEEMQARGQEVFDYTIAQTQRWVDDVRGCVQTIEHDAVALVDEMIEQVRSQLETNVPGLAPIIDRVKESIDKADQVFKSRVGVAVSSLPIEDYDQLNVRSILRRLSKLTDLELELVQRYESINKNRTTILTEINARL